MRAFIHQHKAGGVPARLHKSARLTLRLWQVVDLEPVMKLFQVVVHTTGAKYYRPEQVNAWAPQEGGNKSKWVTIQIPPSFVGGI